MHVRCAAQVHGRAWRGCGQEGAPPLQWGPPLPPSCAQRRAAPQKYLEDELGRANVQVMRTLKAALDPRGVLNPGKLVP